MVNEWVNNQSIIMNAIYINNTIQYRFQFQFQFQFQFLPSIEYKRSNQSVMRFHLVNINHKHTQSEAECSIDGTEHEIEREYQQLVVIMRIVVLMMIIIINRCISLDCVLNTFIIYHSSFIPLPWQKQSWVKIDPT